MKKVKTDSEKKSKDGCPKHCKGRLIGARICWCLESQLPKLSRSSVRAYPAGEAIERRSETVEEWAPVKEIPKAEAAQRLRAYLQDYEVELLLLKFWEDLPFKEIVKKSGWTSTGAASHALKSALSKLRKAKFKWR